MAVECKGRGEYMRQFMVTIAPSPQPLSPKGRRAKGNGVV